MAEFQKVSVKNTEKGPRGIHAKDGLVLVEAGQTVEVELSAGELKSAEATGYFEFGGKAAKKEKKEAPSAGAAAGDGLDALSFKDLKALAKERGVTIPFGSKAADVVALLRAAPAPAPVQTGEGEGKDGEGE